MKQNEKNSSIKTEDQMTLKEIERRVIIARLYAMEGIRWKTAKSLAISQGKLKIKLREYQDQGYVFPPARSGTPAAYARRLKREIAEGRGRTP